MDPIVVSDVQLAICNGLLLTTDETPDHTLQWPQSNNV